MHLGLHRGAAMVSGLRRKHVFGLGETDSCEVDETTFSLTKLAKLFLVDFIEETTIIKYLLRFSIARNHKYRPVCSGQINLSVFRTRLLKIANQMHFQYKYRIQFCHQSQSWWEDIQGYFIWLGDGSQ